MTLIAYKHHTHTHTRPFILISHAYTHKKYTVLNYIIIFMFGPTLLNYTICFVWYTSWATEGCALTVLCTTMILLLIWSFVFHLFLFLTHYNNNKIIQNPKNSIVKEARTKSDSLAKHTLTRLQSIRKLLIKRRIYLIYHWAYVIVQFFFHFITRIKVHTHTHTYTNWQQTTTNPWRKNTMKINYFYTRNSSILELINWIIFRRPCTQPQRNGTVWEERIIEREQQAPCPPRANLRRIRKPRKLYLNKRTHANYYFI